MNRRQKIIVSVTGIFLVLLILVGLTYAYFLTRINGNKNDESISLTTAFLSLTYADGTGDLIRNNEVISPNFTGTKEFTITNDGNAAIDAYAVVLEEYGILYANDDPAKEIAAGDVTELTAPEDFQIVMTCTAYENYGKTGQKVVNDGCVGIENGHLPSSNQSEILVTNSIGKGITHKYVLTLTYKETGFNQSADMNKIIKGKINIIDPVNTVMLTGNVEATDVNLIEVSSDDPKVSYVLNGEYKIFGIAPDNHTMTMFDKAESMLATKTFSLIKGEKPGVSGTTITIDGSVESISINIDSSKAISIGNVISGNPFASGTLANVLYKNAKNKTNGTELSSIKKTGSALSKTGIFKNVNLSDLYDRNRNYGYYVYDSESLAYENYLNDRWYGGKVGTLNTSCNDSLINKYLVIEDAYSMNPEKIFKVSGCNGTEFVVDTDLVYDSSLNTESVNGGTEYYYRGAVKDNYIVFADKCWKIVGIRSDGSIEIILNNKNTTCIENPSDIDVSISNSITGDPDEYFTASKYNELLSFQESFTTSQLSDMRYGNWKNNFNEVVSEYDMYGEPIGETIKVYVSSLTKDDVLRAGYTSSEINMYSFLSDGAWQYLDGEIVTYSCTNFMSNTGLNDTCGSTHYIRPVIALKNGIEYASGNGLVGNPYKVK